MKDKGGFDLIAAGWAGLSGTDRIVRAHAEALKTRFPNSYIREIEAACRLYPETEEKLKDLAERGILSAWEPAAECPAGTAFGSSVQESPAGIAFLFPAGEGGIFAALWKMAEALGTGLSVQLRRIPVRQETVEVCEWLDLHPYMLESRGMALLVTSSAAEVLDLMESEGVHASLIGRTAKGNDRVLHIDDRVMYLTRPQPDELRKVLKRQTR